MTKFENKAYKFVGGGKTDNSMKRIVWANNAGEANLFLSWHDQEFLEKAEQGMPVLAEADANGLKPSGTVMKWTDWISECEAKEKAAKKATTSAGSKSTKRNS